MIDTDAIVHRFYDPGSTACRVLMEHSRCVADKACRIADRVPHLAPDRVFIEEAALLHDIGVIHTTAPAIGCRGAHPYVFHGVLGRDILDDLGLPRHALVAERHTLTGITKDAIAKRNLGLPLRDMVPLTLEETIVCYADKFFSKTPGAIGREKSVDEILNDLSRFGEDHVLTFRRWLARFGN
ncbi:HD domain-containing protein [Desulfatiferula olefinivorans]